MMSLEKAINEEKIKVVFDMLDLFTEIMDSSWDMSLDMLRDRGISLSEELLIEEAYDTYSRNIVESIMDAVGLTEIEEDKFEEHMCSDCCMN